MGGLPLPKRIEILLGYSGSLALDWTQSAWKTVRCIGQQGKKSEIAALLD